MPVIVVQGAAGAGDVPGLAALAGEAELRFATTADELRAALEGADVLLGWNFAAAELGEVWDAAGSLRWIHWSGAGVDAILFSELIESEVILTNARGVFDRAMAEYVLGLMIAMAKRFPETFAAQAERRWAYQWTERLDGRRALIVGVGGIGREIARTLRAFGLEVEGVGRRAREADPDFGTVHAAGALESLLPGADYVVLVAPRTPETEGMIGRAELRAMKPTARLVNVGRGSLIDEDALVAALRAGEIAGAALDVFRAEPLPEDSPLWALDSVIVSPHMSGDYVGYSEALAALFLDNWRRFRAGEPLRNVVDKSAGYVPAG